MTKLTWDSTGTRFFETGIDRGILYLDSAPGVAWSGLTSVSEVPLGGSITPFYIDGEKYMNYTAKEEFEATITAYTYPDEFDQCIGLAGVANGLFASQQAKKSFGFVYRTRVGNDADGVQHAYKLHLVYNASAEPSNFSNNTLKAAIDAGEFSWHIVTKPPLVAGYTPTAHFVIDSRDTPAPLLDEIEGILYGNDADDARLPSAEELLFVFSEYGTSIFDAGYLTEEYFEFFDDGTVPHTTGPSMTIDGGGP